MTHPATVLSLWLKGQWGWEKPTGQQAGKEWRSSRTLPLGPAWRLTYSKRHLSAKTVLWEAERDKESYLLLPKALKGGWKVHLWRKQDFISQCFPNTIQQLHVKRKSWDTLKSIRRHQLLPYFHCNVHTTIYLINIDSNLVDLRQNSPSKSNSTKMVRRIQFSHRSYWNLIQ